MRKFTRSASLLLLLTIISFGFQNCAPVLFSGLSPASGSKFAGGPPNIIPDDPGDPPGPTPTPTPTPPGGEPPAQKGILALHDVGSSGAHHRCVITVDNDAYCAGENGWGQLGSSVASTESSMATYLVPGLKFTQVVVGYEHTCGLAVSGAAYCWGRNYVGQTGQGTVSASATPGVVAGQHQFKQLSAGWFHTCGVTVGNDVYCWGANVLGQLGNATQLGTSTAVPTPVLVQGGIKFKQVSVSSLYATCAVAVAGDVYCWGMNAFGALGNTTDVWTRNIFTNQPITPGPGVIHASPTIVAGLRGVKQLTSWWYGICALTDAGQTSCWGALGNVIGNNGEFAYSATPRVLLGAQAFSQVVKSAYMDCGITAAGEPYCWKNAQMLSGANVPMLSVPGGYRFFQLSGSNGHVCGLTLEKRAFCWKYDVANQALTTPQALIVQ